MNKLGYILKNKMNWELILKSLYVLFFITTIIYSNLFYNYVETIKYFSLIFLSVLFFIIGSVYIAKRNIQVSINIIDLVLLIIVIVVLIKVLLINTPLNDKDLILLYSLLVFYFINKVLSGSLERERLLDVISNLILLTTLLHCILGLLQYFNLMTSLHPYFSLTGSFTNPGPYSIFLVMLYPFSLDAIIKSEVGYKKIVGAVNVFMIFIVLILTKSRTAWVTGVIVTLLSLNMSTIFKLESIKRNLKRYKYKIPIILILLIIFILAAKYLYFLKLDSSNGRLFTWFLTLKLFFKNVFWGCGFGAFPVNLNMEKIEFFHRNELGNLYFEKIATSFRHAFNDYLEAMASFGLIVFLLIVYILYLLTIKTKYSRKENPFYISFVGVLVSAFFTYVVSGSNTLIFFIFLLLSILSARVKKILRLKIPYATTTFFIFCCLAVYVSYISAIRFSAELKWKEIIVEYKNIPQEESFRRFENLNSVMNYNYLFLFNYAELAYRQGRYEKSIAILNDNIEKLNDYDVYVMYGENYSHLGYFTKAISFYDMATKVEPNRFIPYYKKFKLYQHYGDSTNARICAQQIIEKNVKINSPTVEQIINETKNYINQSNNINQSNALP